MASSARTANAIIASVLKRIGNETITTEAQYELANIVTRLCEDYRWPFLRATATGSIVAADDSVALPSTFGDLWSRFSAKLIDTSTGTYLPLQTMSVADYDLLENPATEGQPTHIIIDFNALTFRVYPLPEKTYNYEIIYRQVPARITDFTVVVAGFPNDSLLSQLLFVWACQYEDDDRYMGELAVAEKMLRTYLKRYNLSPTKGATLALAPATFSGMSNIR